MKSIHRERLLISFMILAAVTVFTYIVNTAYKQGVLGDNAFVHVILFICRSWYCVVAFPNIILYVLGLFQNLIAFALGVSTGALFWGLVIEFVLIKYRKKERPETGNTTPGV